MLKEILNDDLLIDGQLKVVDNEVIYNVNKKAIYLNSDLKYRLLLQGFNEEQKQEAEQVLNACNLHYVIENMDFFRPVVLLSNGDATIEFKSCYFHSTVDILKADKIILNNCSYYLNKKSDKKNDNIYGRVNYIKIENEISAESIGFNMTLYADEKIEIVNSKLKRDRISLYTKNLDIIDSEICLMAKKSEISSDNLCAKNSVVSSECLSIKAPNMDLSDSNIVGNDTLKLFTNSECDLNLIESPILEYNCIKIKQKIKK